MIKIGPETDFPSEVVKEGQVQVIVPKLAAFKKYPSDYAPSKAPVFYNPIMELNRDIAVLVARVYQHKVNREISICEPLTSSGIRGVRLATEVHNAKVTLGDISKHAFHLAKRNVALNMLDERATVLNKDANCLLSCHSAPRARFDIVDVDPVGSPVPYLDSAIRALRNKGVLAVTATDLAPLCGVHVKACVRKYGGKPLRTEYCQELAIRLLAGCIAIAAAKQDIGTRVVYSHSTDHYIRVYIEMAYGAKKADESVNNIGYILHCFDCLHRETAKTMTGIGVCPECGGKMDYAGPLWLGHIFDKLLCDLIAKENEHIAFKNGSRIATLLSVAKDEAEAPATYYVVDKVSNKLRLPVPPLATMIEMLHDCGFNAVPTHFSSRGFRTDAPALKIQGLLRKAVKTD
jgi:tRNA (guanine26-N2/guanine27-N2)-dimethyltransferase